MEDPELEAIRQRRMAEMQAQAQQQMQDQAQQQAQAQKVAEQKMAILRQIMTPEARDRLANVRLANPQMAETVENHLIQLAQSGRLGGVIEDSMLRNILAQISSQTREISIQRR